MEKLKLERKLKKKLKKGFWLYSPDEKGNSLMARPHQNEKDYEAYKNGEVRDLFSEESRKERHASKQKLDVPIEVSDEVLKEYVNKIFSKEYRNSSYQFLLDAKKFRDTKVAYYHFLNAYKVQENGDDSMSNVCCLAADYARDLLKIRKKRRKNNKKRK
ncbi:hypothetical protein [Halpernia frigidisoli]|uniref:Uncharacterized protein n=1 Tax=Halpernia frigidisoli TaxID=1125876 RepID=A0A1I3HQ48_9FLAO|nr:hypothetical protein [Halpernia frigidisoli]SFI37650.1 hypothetical protein SAMN05443292_2325 [Halpernia frigidisoli]